MGEAYLVRKGGAVFRDLELIAPPDRLDYYPGQYVDVAGAIIGAKFGTFSVPLHRTAWSFSPTRPLVASDTEIVVSATIGRQTKTMGIPITVENFAVNLDENSWAQIAKAAELGVASEIWHVGDIKYETINGKTIGCRIIGFDADPLHATDAKYNDTTYNAGKNKAAITFQYTNTGAYGSGLMYINQNNKNTGGWLQSDMRRIQMPRELELCPADMRSVIRTVSKFTAPGGHGTTLAKRVDESADEMFILAVQEVFGKIQNPSGDIGEKEAEVTTQYAWYAEGHSPVKYNSEEWLRSPHDPNVCSSQSDYGYITTNGVFNMYAYPNVNKMYYPAFNI